MTVATYNYRLLVCETSQYQSPVLLAAGVTNLSDGVGFFLTDFSDAIGEIADLGDAGVLGRCRRGRGHGPIALL